MLGSIEERFLGGDELGDISRSDYHAELSGLADKNADLVHTFQFGVAFHHAGALCNSCFAPRKEIDVLCTRTGSNPVSLPKSRLPEGANLK